MTDNKPRLISMKGRTHDLFSTRKHPESSLLNELNPFLSLNIRQIKKIQNAVLAAYR